MNKNLNNLANGITLRFAEAQKYRRKQEKEAREGKQELWILRTKYGALVLYAEGNLNTLTSYDIPRCKELGYLRVMPKKYLAEIIEAEKELHLARKKYVDLLERIFKGAK